MKRGIDITGVIVPDEWAAIEAMLTQRSLTPRLRERLEMVKAAYQGADLQTIGRWSGRTEETVRRWLRVFREGGAAALADAPRSGRPVRADAAYLAALEAAVEANPKDLGQGFDVWTSARLSAYLAETTGTRIAPGWLRVLLHRQRFANGRPKHSVAHLQDPVEVAACVERLRVGGKVKAEPDRDELHFEDERHVETNPHLGQIWRRVGQQPVLPAAGTNRRLTVFGSVAAEGRGRVELLTARADSTGFARYLAVLDARHTVTPRWPRMPPTNSRSSPTPARGTPG